jgi:ribosomal protein S27AE
MDFLTGVDECKAKRDRLPSGPMVTKQKINREKVMDALNTLCPKCGYAIPPGEIRRIDCHRMECPRCGEAFTPGSAHHSSD